MSKTVPLREDIHTLIVDKQKELKAKRNITVRISDLIAVYVRHGIDETEKLLGLKEDKKSAGIDETEKLLGLKEDKKSVDIENIKQEIIGPEEEKKNNDIRQHRCT